MLRLRAHPRGPRPGQGGSLSAPGDQVREGPGRGLAAARLQGSHNSLYGTLKEGTRIFHSVKPSTNIPKDMRAGNRPNSYERNGLTWI